MKIKICEAEGPVLEWLVTTCEVGEAINYVWQHTKRKISFLTDWSQGGPIIEREGIATRKSKGKWYAMLSNDLGDGERAQWSLYTFRNIPKTASTSRRCRFEGPTALIAAMRCYCCSKLGEEVEVPDALC